MISFFTFLAQKRVAMDFRLQFACKYLLLLTHETVLIGKNSSLLNVQSENAGLNFIGVNTLVVENLMKVFGASL